MSIDGLSFSEGSDGAGEGGEVSEAVLEAYREKAAQSAKQARKDKKQEGKRKQQEDVLTRIIIQFLNTPRYSGFFVVISRVVSKNVPADFILAILALIHKQSLDILNAKDIPLKSPPKNSTSVFPPELSKHLTHWTTLLYSVASAEPHKILETVLDREWKRDKNIIKLMKLVIQEFFTFKKFDVSPENIEAFADTFIEKLVLSLENQVHNQNKIA